MKPYTSIAIIYNPNSTGNSKANAQHLQKRLKKALSEISITCVPTKQAGHAEDLAYNFAAKGDRPLIISSSGDGGYHEVINGAIKAQNKGASPICAVLPAGNANDHSRTMHKKPLLRTIKKAKITKLDLLKVTIKTTAGKPVIRYAHSYIGLGLTPVIAAELNKHTLNAFKEMVLVLKTFTKYRPFRIRQDGKILSLDSLIFGNINHMAKVLTLAKKNKPDDGLFEVVMFPHGRKRELVQKLVKAATTGLKTTRQESEYEFETLEKMPMQLDGEVTELVKGSKVRIEVANKVLSTIV